MGQRFSDASTGNGGNGFGQLVGQAAETLALYAMDPNSAYGADGQTVQDQIAQLWQQRTALRDLYQNAVPMLGALSGQDLAGYQNRVQQFGEVAALQWVTGKFGQK